MNDKTIKLMDLFNEPMMITNCGLCGETITPSHEPFVTSIGAMCGDRFISNALVYLHPACASSQTKEKL